MKPLVRSLLVLTLVLVLSFNMSCDILTPLDPDQKIEKEAWDVLLEAHAMKQLWFYRYFSVYSGDYARGQLFASDPPKYQINALWDEFQLLLSYSDAVDAAVDSLESLSASLGKPVASSSIFGALKSFFGAGKEVNVNNRKRLLLIASNMNQMDRNQLYDELVIDTWKSEIGTADQFWTKLQNGDLDDKASTFYKNFYDGSNALLNPFTGLANDKKLTPGQMLAKDGINLCNKGLDVVLETGKLVVPGLGQATDIIEEGKDFYEKSQKMVDKPLEFIKDEIKSRAAAKIVGMTDVDNVLNTDGIGNYVKILAETSLGTDDPQELVEKGIDYGIAKISSSDASVQTDVAIAKNQQPGPGLPEFIIGIGTYAQKANEFFLTLPAGDWNITAKDNTGNSALPAKTTVVSQQETVLDVTTFSGEVEDSDSLDIEDVDFDRLLYMFMDLNVGGYAFRIPYYHTDGGDLSWLKNTFSLDTFFDTTATNYHSFETSIAGSISLISYDQVGLYAQIELTDISYGGYNYLTNSYGSKSFMDELTLNINGLPIVPSTFDTSHLYIQFNFEIPEGESINSYVSFSFTRTDYVTSGENIGNVEDVIIQNTFNYDDAYSQPAIFASLRSFTY